MLNATKALYLQTIFLFVLAGQSLGVEMSFGPDDADGGPVKVVSEEVVFDQENGVMEFVGGVRVTQGDVILTSNHAKAFSNKDNKSRVELIILNSDVYLETGQGTATADSGEYDLVKRTIELVGHVVIKTGEIEFSANGLHYDLESGLSRLIDDARVLLKDVN